MSKFEFISSDDETSFDILVEAEFEKKLEGSNILEVLDTIVSVLKMNLAARFFEELAFLEITEERLKMKMRFATRGSNAQNLQPQEAEDISRQKAQFVFYLFALIDSKFRFDNHPFPPDFRAFIEFPQYFE
jgi:hypothetical protein